MFDLNCVPASVFCSDELIKRAVVLSWIRNFQGKIESVLCGFTEKEIHILRNGENGSLYEAIINRNYLLFDACEGDKELEQKIIAMKPEDQNILYDYIHIYINVCDVVKMPC